jgi:predicted aldo/keto reductase-like oxidoreductase
MAGVMAPGQGFASQCSGCGVCETKCPQGIPIRQELKAVAKEFEGILTKPMTWLMKAVIGKITKVPGPKS